MTLTKLNDTGLSDALPDVALGLLDVSSHPHVKVENWSYLGRIAASNRRIFASGDDQGNGEDRKQAHSVG